VPSSAIQSPPLLRHQKPNGGNCHCCEDIVVTEIAWAPMAYEFIVSRSGSQDDFVGVYSSAISGLGNLYEKSKSPPCRKERDKDGATSRMITWKGWASLQIKVAGKIVGKVRMKF
jgi:hypothetical protein